MLGRGARAAAAITGAAVAATALAACSGPPPQETDNYSFFTRTDTANYDDEELIYVVDGRVRAVAISDEAVAREYYGYTPMTIAEHLVQAEPPPEPPEGYDAQITWVKGVPTAICESWPEQETTCRQIWEVHTLSPRQAAQEWQWDIPTDGTFIATVRSVTWDLPSSWEVTVAEGVITSATQVAGDSDWRQPTWEEITQPGRRDQYRVTYWSSPRGELPVAVCYDEPNSYDEEYCWSITPQEPGGITPRP